MIIHKAYKFRLYPTKAQETLIHKTFGCTRFVYNYCLDLKRNNKHLTKFDLIKELPNLKKEYPFLREVDSCSLQNAITDLMAGFGLYEKGIGGYPKLKKKGEKESFRTSFVTSSYKGTVYENIKVDLTKRVIELPKLKEIKIRGYRNLDKLSGRILNATIREVESMPTSGYTINEEMSYLDNVNHDNEAILYINSDGEHVISGLKKNSKCYLYFDEYVGPLPIIDVIEDAYNNNPTMFANDNTVDNNLRYIGANPNNYVYFNCDDYNNPSSDTCELWRIIGVMNNMETASGTTESLVKLIRNDSIGSYSWDDENVNDWSASSLQESLNGSYLQGTTFGNGKGITEETRNMVETITWKLGGSSTYNDVTASMFYERERGTTVYSGRPTEWSGKVGLMYASDYGYATGSTTNRENCLANGLDSWSNCHFYDWLFESFQWTLTSYSSTSYNVFIINNIGRLFNSSSNSTFGVRPSIYLKSNIAITGGNGDINSPYTLEA